jgi:pseudaminic acid synthase
MNADRPDPAEPSETMIAGRAIGRTHPPFIIAEMSGNHNGEIERAIAIIDAAAEAGADAVKLQTYTADTITIDHDAPQFRIESGLWAGRSLYELYEEAHTPWDWHPTLFARARELGIAIFSAPFDPTAVDFLASLDAPAFKIASFEAVDLALIEKAASVGKPLIISTGMANLEEIEEAVTTARQAGTGEIILLHCVSGYPTPPGEANLMTIPDLAARFGVQIGLSDHTLGTAVANAAVALGATVIEKHVTLSRSDGGPDAAFSLEPNELANLVKQCRTAWQALGVPTYTLKKSEADSVIFRRSLYVTADIAAGETLSDQNVRSIRPGYGLAPKHLREILGRTAARDIARGTPLDWTLVSD